MPNLARKILLQIRFYEARLLTRVVGPAVAPAKAAISRRIPSLRIAPQRTSDTPPAG